MVQKTDKFAILQALLLDANKRCIFQYDRNLLKLYINLTVYRKEVLSADFTDFEIQEYLKL